MSITSTFQPFVTKQNGEILSAGSCTTNSHSGTYYLNFGFIGVGVSFASSCIGAYFGIAEMGKASTLFFTALSNGTFAKISTDIEGFAFNEYDETDGLIAMGAGFAFSFIPSFSNKRKIGRILNRVVEFCESILEEMFKRII